MDSSAAKEFLIAKAVEEAGLEHVALSEIEKKMLYFTEVHPSLPDIYEVNAEFEKNYDSSDYEAKIEGLLKGARHRDNKRFPSREQDWKDALAVLKNEDHYILVMADQAFGSSSNETVRRRKVWTYILMGIVFALYIAWEVLRQH